MSVVDAQARLLVGGWQPPRVFPIITFFYEIPNRQKRVNRLLSNEFATVTAEGQKKNQIKYLCVSRIILWKVEETTPISNDVSV